jgi:putative zinc finger/helix-turn-helix YgiT family protein
MKCFSCGSTMTNQKEDYHYRESGLDNIVLADMAIYRCSCGEEFVSIPAVPELNKVIGIGLLKKKYLLEGKEIKFLRKNLGFSSNKMAEYLRVDLSTYSRWEKGKQNPKPSNDRLIRSIYAIIKGVESKLQKSMIEDVFPEKAKIGNIFEFIEIKSQSWVTGDASCLITA